MANSWRGRLHGMHRWLGFVISVQLLAWSVGGLAFSLLPLDDVRGELERRHAPRPLLDEESVGVGVAQAIVTGKVCGSTARAVLRHRLDLPVYELFDVQDKPLCLLDARTGAVLPPLSEPDAVRIAKADFAVDAPVLSSRLIERDPPIEYRGRPLPAWQIALQHPKQPRLYVSALTGEVTARRNARWRMHDFFWMLHVMDYTQRESYNHWLLTLASVAAIATALTGVLIQLLRLRPRSARTNTPSA
jgi:hypothetical protein